MAESSSATGGPLVSEGSRKCRARTSGQGSGLPVGLSGDGFGSEPTATWAVIFPLLEGLAFNLEKTHHLGGR